LNRILGVDFGGKRIGLAVGEAEFGIFSPRPALAASGTLRVDAAAILAKAKEEEASMIVVGIPEFEADSRMSRVIGKLVDELRGLGASVETVDEAFTSVAAHQTMLEAGMKGSARRKAVDGNAACLILERWVAARG
jgi:putative Holliday junction resolvase